MARSQQLVVDNERMRKEAAITLYEDALHFPYDSHKGHGGNSADGPTEEEHALASPSDAAGKSFAPRVLASSASHRRQQLAARARRILREAVRLRLANDASSSVHAWALGGLSMSKLAKVALEIAKVSDALRGSEFFADLGERQLAMMASAGQRRKLGRYSVLYREAAISTCFYVIIGGSLLEQSLSPTWKHPPLKPGQMRPKGVRKDRRNLVCDRRAGCVFTLIGMESVVGRPRTSTITVLEDTELLRFQATDLNIRRDGAAQIARKVFNAFLEGELAATSAFKGLPSKALKLVVPLLVLEEYDAGTTLFVPGNPGDKVFIVMHGSVTIMKSTRVIATLSAEQGQATSAEQGMPVFGHMALVDRGSLRRNTAVCATDTKLLVLPLESWASAIMAAPDLTGRLRRVPVEVG